MSDRAATTLSLTPVALPWMDAVERVVAYLATAHEAERVVPTDATLQLVDPTHGKILSRKPVNLADNFGDEAGGITMWRSLSIAITLGGSEHIASFAFRDVGGATTHVEVWFPESVWRGVFADDPDRKKFDAGLKADLLQLCAGMSRALLADGFAYRSALEDSLFGAVSVEYLREYLEAGIPQDHSPPLMAGVAAHIIEVASFPQDFELPSYYYRYGRYCVWDLVWPELAMD